MRDARQNSLVSARHTAQPASSVDSRCQEHKRRFDHVRDQTASMIKYQERPWRDLRDARERDSRLSCPVDHNMYPSGEVSSIVVQALLHENQLSGDVFLESRVPRSKGLGCLNFHSA